MQKPIIDVKDALHDIRMGLDDSDLMKKYQLSAKGLQSMFKKLLGLGVITQGELGRGPVPEIKAKDAVRDIRSGMDDFALMDKYSLSAKGLQSLFDQLLAAGLLKQGELDLRMPYSEGTVDLASAQTDGEEPPVVTTSHEKKEGSPPDKEADPDSDITISLKWECPSCGIYQDSEQVVCPVCRAVVGKLPQHASDETAPFTGRQPAGSTEVLSEDDLVIEDEPTPSGPDAETIVAPPPQQIVVASSHSYLEAPTALISGTISTNRTINLEWVCPNCGLYQDRKYAKCPECGFEESSLDAEIDSQPLPVSTGEPRIPTLEILNDIRSGVDRATLMSRYGLSQEGAQEFFAKLGSLEAHGSEPTSNQAAVGALTEPKETFRSEFAETSTDRLDYLTAQLIRAADKGNVNDVVRLLKRGADVNGADEEGQTPLIWAAMWGYVPVIKVLLDQGADVSRRTKDGTTALMCASAMRHEEAKQLLLEHGSHK